jgi:uroporphyrinogen decarboxylase
MRQAGRYLPGYRALRERYGILEIARTPELAAQVTVEPMERFDVDAGVVFADIMLPLGGLGIEFSIDPGRGPVLPRPVRSSVDLRAWQPFDPASVAFVGEAIRRFHQLIPDRPIVGFAGAPFTLATYLVEGAASREFPATRQMLYRDRELFEALLERLLVMTGEYLRLQAVAGADALQVFDTYAGILPTDVFRAVVRPGLQRLFEFLRPLDLPTIYFSTGSSHLLPDLAEIGASALSVDWRERLSRVRTQVGPELTLQGNLDPGVLLGTPARVREMAQSVLDELPDGRSHVFNLGHGVLPSTDPDRVQELVEYVHERGAPGLAQ